MRSSRGISPSLFRSPEKSSENKAVLYDKSSNRHLQRCLDVQDNALGPTFAGYTNKHPKLRRQFRVHGEEQWPQSRLFLELV